MTETQASVPTTRTPSDALIGGALFCLALAVYAYTLCPTIFADDCGEIATAVATGGVMHPPGYPLYCIVGGLFVHLLPFGEPAFRLGLLSALSAALTVSATYHVSRDLGAGRRWSAAGALALAFSISLWMQATKVETYALNALFVAGILMLAIRYNRSGKPVHLLQTALVGGLALTNHLTIVWLIPAILCLIVPRAIEARAIRSLLGAVGVCLVPLVLYFYEIIAARAHPGGQVWGNTSNLHRLLLHVSGTRYHGLFHLPTLSWFYQRDILFAPSWLWHNLGPLLVLSVIGAWALLRQPANHRPGLALIVGVVGYLICNTLYHILNIFEYYTPAILMLSVLAAVGGQVATDWLRACLEAPDAKRPIEMLHGSAVLLALLIPIMVNWHACNRHEVTCMRVMAENLLATLPQGSILVAFGDNNVFPLWYVQEVLHERPDVAVVPRDFFKTWTHADGREIDGWCIARIQREHPEIGVGALFARCAHDPAYAASRRALWDVVGTAMERGQPVYFTAPQHDDLTTDARGRQYFAKLPAYTVVNEGLLAHVVPTDNKLTPDQLLQIELEAEKAIAYQHVDPKLFTYEPDGDITNKVYASHLLKIGRLLTNKKQYQAAYDHLSHACQIDENSALAADALGYASAMLGRTDDAVDAWRSAVRLDPGNADYKRNLATAQGHAQ